MRRAAAVLAAVVLGACALAASSAPALASHGAATPFKVAYEYPEGTYWDCAGARVDNRVSVKDSETCLVTGDTSMLSVGTFSGHPRGDLPWFPNARIGSDYDGQIALDWTIRVTDNGDGSFTMYVVAYFLYH